MSQTINVELTTSPVELYKILKFEGLASSGAEAKMLVAQGLVTVNGETETRKRRKIVAGDEIAFEDVVLLISN
ncbi:RNA-binding S4 domain-containing protein [Methylophaga sp. OBS4]|uniref:RNA-binding S4 domain-containing protein n=1 Tax=Methylophaga sp. OBS4 TaxID=2991935 RepID=UPI00224D3305|nr:RNA-binding S4 domain-containing protein [Methylophaga sp. OBS4]MCX4188240.1 RNA-binding S4 domain-containing protein [Methylophaga sp. OBS4]